MNGEKRSTECIFSMSFPCLACVTTGFIFCKIRKSQHEHDNSKSFFSFVPFCFFGIMLSITIMNNNKLQYCSLLTAQLIMLINTPVGNYNEQCSLYCLLLSNIIHDTRFQLSNIIFTKTQISGRVREPYAR